MRGSPGVLMPELSLPGEAEVSTVGGGPAAPSCAARGHAAVSRGSGPPMPEGHHWKAVYKSGHCVSSACDTGLRGICWDAVTGSAHKTFHF